MAGRRHAPQAGVRIQVSDRGIEVVTDQGRVADAKSISITVNRAGELVLLATLSGGGYVRGRLTAGTLDGFRFGGGQ